MTKSKKSRNYFHIVLIAAVLVLLGLWLRENEMRVSAQSKLSNLEMKSTTVINEKGEAIADLSTQLGEMQANLQKNTEDYTGRLGDKDQQILKMEEDQRLAQAEYEGDLQEKTAAYTDLEAQMKADAERSGEALKKKNTELSEMGEELRKTTERLAKALKDKERAESENYDLKQQSTSGERKLDKLREDNRRLESLVKVCAQPAPDTAEGVPSAGLTAKSN